jgi:hypothetical protein
MTAGRQRTLALAGNCLQCVRSNFPGGDPPMSTIEERVKKIVVEQLGVK